jgi:hypothetical protein
VVLLQGTCTCLLTGGKSVHALRSHICGLDVQTEPPFDCADDDSGDAAFVKATKFIGGQDTMEEYLACDVYSVSPGVKVEITSVKFGSCSQGR